MNRFLLIPDINRLEESLSLAEEYGLGFEYNDFWSPDVLDDMDKVRAMAKIYHSHKLPELITMHGDFFDVLVFSSDRLIREISELRIKQSIEAARIIGAGAVIFHTNHNPFFKAEGYVNNWLRCNIDFWSRALEENPDISIYIENMCDDSPDMLAALAKELSAYDNFGVCLDYAHAAVFGKDPEVWCKTLSPYVNHMHINDNDLNEDLHLAVGEGRIDWEQFRALITEYCPDATVLIETSSIERQRRSAEFLRRLGML